MLPAGSPLSAWLTWLETLSPREIDLGLERVREVLGRLDLELPEHVLLIAGTNGKGSSVAMADALLRGAGYRVGAYTSPHVIDYNERISVGGRHASDDDIIVALETIEAVRNDVPLTYFEYGTLAAFVVFARAALDVWILEVGMGGRLDATNVIDPTGVLITNVSLDHCDWLGADVETIAAEKAGAMRRGVPVVYGDAGTTRSSRRHSRACPASSKGRTRLPCWRCSRRRGWETRLHRRWFPRSCRRSVLRAAGSASSVKALSGCLMSHTIRPQPRCWQPRSRPQSGAGRPSP